jgi:glycosyltransferase involved in cell wall biosynthesis
MDMKTAADILETNASHRCGRIKILHVVESTVAGTRKHVHTLVTRLPKDRFEVHVACPARRCEHYGDDYFTDQLAEAGIAFHVVPLARTITRPDRDLVALAALVRLCRRERFDIVHCHGSKGGFLGRTAGWCAGSRRVFTPNSFAFQGDCGSLKACLYRVLEKAAGRVTDVLIAVSESERSVAVEAGIVPPDRVRLIHNAVDPDEVVLPADRAGLRRELGLSADAKVVGFTGRLAEQKAVDVLIDAFALVLPHVASAHLLVIGSGELEHELKEQVNRQELYDRIHFLGHRRDVPELLGVMDCFVLPSLYEGLSYSLLEAMAVGLPIVATRAPGNEGAIVDGESGFLVPMKDPGAIAGKVVQILTDNEIGRRIGQGARTAVIERFSPAAHVDRHIAVYEELMLSSISRAASAARSAS